MARTLIFWLQVPGMTLYLQLICPAGAWLQMAGVHNLFRLNALVICDHCPPPPQGNLEDFHFVTFILCLQFPIVFNHHTVGTASWQNHDSLLLYCTAMVASQLTHNVNVTFAKGPKMVWSDLTFG